MPSWSTFATRLITGVWPNHPPNFRRNPPPSQEPLAPPLPPRTRSLTLDDGAFNSATPNAQSAAYAQTSSLLFRLPRELRLEIYVYVLAGRTIHLGVDETGLTPFLRHYYCKTEDLDPNKGRAFHPCWYPLGGRPRDPVEKLLSLLLTCRRVYSEAITVLYAQNTFHIIEPAVLFSLPSLILPTRLDSIRTLVLYCSWDDFPPREGSPADQEFTSIWPALNRMAGLKLLHVHLMATALSHDDWWILRHEAWLSGVTELRQRVQDFKVYLPLTQGTLEAVADKGPCEVWRRT